MTLASAILEIWLGPRN